MTDIIFQAYFENENFIIWIGYEPGPDGAIFVIDVSIEPRQVSPFEQRQVKRRRGLVLDEQEQHTEAMQPTTRREQMELFE